MSEIEKNPTKSFACALIDNNIAFEMLMKDNQKYGIERGLKASLNTEMYKELSNMFSACMSKGYYVTGFILNDKNEIEFLFQRDKNQKSKLIEEDTSSYDKFKM